MRTGTLRGLINKHVGDHGGNVQQGYESAANHLGRLIAENKVQPNQFSIKELFEELVDPQHNFDMRSSAVDIAEAMSASAFPVISNRIIHGTIMPQYELHQSDLARLVTEDNASRTQKETVAGMTDEGSLEYRGEFESYQETEFGEKDVTIFTADFGRIISLSHEAIFDDRTGEIQRRARNIGRKAGLHRAKMIAQTIEMLPRTAFKEATPRGFTYKGTSFSQANFYANSHAAVSGLDGQVNDNLQTTALGTAGLTSALILLGNMTDTVGDEHDVMAQFLLVPEDLAVLAWQLLSSTVAFDNAASSANNATGRNYFGPGGPGRLTPVSSRLLSSSSLWYIGDFLAQLLWLWVWKPATAQQGNNSTKAFESQIVQRYRFNYAGGVGHLDYRNIVRSGS